MQFYKYQSFFKIKFPFIDFKSCRAGLEVSNGVVLLIIPDLIRGFMEGEVPSELPFYMQSISKEQQEEHEKTKMEFMGDKLEGFCSIQEEGTV